MLLCYDGIIYRQILQIFMAARIMFCDDSNFYKNCKVKDDLHILLEAVIQTANFLDPINTYQ
jgi:hypothetical protein